tara:strand:- start:77226 stop:79190 length:1965 start_codon:yes stop_codon:yes gene_type:complete
MKSLNILKIMNKSALDSLRALPAALRGLVFVGLTASLATLPVQAGGLSLGGPPEEAIEDSVEQSVEDSVEEQAQDAAQEAVEDAVEERVLSLGGPPIEQKIEEQVEETVEENLVETVEETVEDTVEESVAENVAEDIENSVEESVEEAVEGVVEETIEETLETGVEQVVESSVEDAVEGAVEESVAAAVEDGVEESVTASVEDSVQESVAASVEESVQDAVTDSVEETVQETVADTVEETVQESVAASVEESVEQGVTAGVEQSVELGVEQAVEVAVAESVEEQLESEIDEILEGIESEFEIDERRINRDQWLVMAEPEVFDKLAEEGYLFATVTELPGMGMRLAEVAAPSSFDISEVRQGVIDVVGKERAEVDLNHIYTAGESIDSPSEEGVSPRTAIRFPVDTDAMSLRIGMIDSRVDVTHPALNKASIEARSFTTDGAQMPDFHGTAIASIIVANADEYQGLAPNAQVFAAAVFEKDEQRGEIASTVSLVRALDWLMSSGVDVVNVSLAGPPNRLLEAALARAHDRGVMVLAAAGNAGPVAQPMYPAAYDSVVAVTAVDRGGQVFRLANRGQYLDIAAPGVSLLHARAGGGYSASSGTSFAVPFAATAAARLRFTQPGQDALQLMYQSAEDLGPPGRDEIYGYGLLRPERS